MSMTQRILTCLFLLLVTSCSSLTYRQNTTPASSQIYQITGTATPVSSQRPLPQNIPSPKPYPDPAPILNPYPFPLQMTLVAIVSQSPSQTPTPASIPKRNEVLLEDLGLIWRECEQEDCLGLTKKETFAEGESPFGEYFRPPGAIMHGWRLSIGNDVYEALHQPYMVKTNSGLKLAYSNPDYWMEYKLFKNGQLLLTRKTKMTGYDPNAGLLNINGKYAWEFANPDEATIIYDGVDLREQYGYEDIYRPYVINGKMIFVARNNGKMFVVVDGKQIGPEYDEINNGYCCETARILRRPGQYWFSAIREGQSFSVSITAIE